uniref:Uncharacterized protein n=1 Tax=Helicotheca tamesis TaxID=374047 RepID=A0A7S2HWW2_9STRA
MNFRSIALALVVTSPTLLAYAENIRKARELRRPPAHAGRGQPQPDLTDPPTHPPTHPPTASPTDSPTDSPTAPEPQEPQQRDQSTDQTSGGRQPVPQSPPPQISSSSAPHGNRNKKPKKKPAPKDAPATSSHSSYPTNDCITYSILNPWESIWGGCPTYKPGFMPWSNYDYCDEDVGPGGVLAEDACPQCGKCLGPENTCVAFGKRRPFDAGYGGCHTYKKGLENHDYCYSDEDNGIKAFQACPECNKCVESSPRTVKISVRFIQALERGDDSTDKLEIIGYLGSQLDRRKHRKFWEKKLPEYQDIFKGKKFYLEKTHYYYDVGDWEYISAKGELSEYDFINGVDPLFAKIQSFNVGKLYHKGTTQIVHVIWLDRRGNKIQAFYDIDVY